MSLTTSFGYANGTPASTPVAIQLHKLSTASKYGCTDRTATTSTLKNKTCSLDAEEVVRYHSRVIPKVDTSLNLQSPPPVKNGILYGVKDEMVLKTTDSSDPTFLVTNPVVVDIKMWHPRSAYITSALLEEALTHAISNFYKDNGDSRFDDLIREAEHPVAD